MRKTFAPFLFFLVLFISCEEKVERPVEVLDLTRMVQLVVDVEKVEAHLRTLDPDKDWTIESKTTYGQLLAKHEISQENFERSYDWWRKHPEQFERIYELALAQLKSEEAEFNRK
ncbi:MAG TPA: hypothetical protein DCS15_09370 [Flavobacteriales bacterium]|nr:DUF4296 domain-containing protein [Salibacteraceae bacterium]HAS36685.1 hypothetical protein [Flavobacteriales bacterium]